MKRILVGLVGLLIFTGCTRQNNEEQDSSLETKETLETTSESSSTAATSQSGDKASTSTSTSQSSSESEETTTSTIEDKQAQQLAEYNDLPENIKVWLATTTVDERAEVTSFRDYIYYNFDQDHLIVNLTSGAGIGHPIFLIDYDEKFIYPVDSFVIVDQSAEAIYEHAPMDTTPVSKIDLLQVYKENQAAFDAGEERVLRNDEFTLSSFYAAVNKIQ